jgi:hypothetical protein
MKRTFRRINISLVNNKVPVFSSRHNQLVKTVVRNATEEEKVQLSHAFDFIEEGLSIKADDATRRSLKQAMEETVFLTLPGTCSTGARAARWWRDLTIPVVYLNRILFERMSFNEFAVTVLHELMHVIETPPESGTNDSSVDEARHDFECYRILNVEVPVTHWVLKEYPGLIDEFPEVKIAGQ